ncbi:DUF6520 family protein [Flavivirga aquimarina]|uniref:DUF6520 family protein n=1 Tax=Flavivirga aquimarina TaxID=2027862 RepID=A0ABT8W630_9FLAO|nr:DUF6520 family protein [Flavivirga aquimarina]MDO5968529.1 DUF6520 family protein [Flavivirga aquimarina]
MKSNFFKIVLPAFALMLAITASLAFTSADSAEDTDTKIVIAEYIHPDTQDCTTIDEVCCQLTGTDLCTAIVKNNAGNDVTVDLFLKTSVCNLILYEYIPE